MLFSIDYLSSKPEKQQTQSSFQWQGQVRDEERK